MENAPIKSPPKIKPSDLTQWCERMGYSQRDAADALGCSRTAFQNWEAGHHDIPAYIGLAMRCLMTANPDDRPHPWRRERRPK